MTARDWVGLAVRIIGFWLVVRGAISFLEAIPLRDQSLSHGMVLLTIWPGSIGTIIVGGWMLLRPGLIIRLVCGANSVRGK